MTQLATGTIWICSYFILARADTVSTDAVDTIWDGNVIEYFDVVNQSLYTVSLHWTPYDSYRQNIKDYMLTVSGANNSPLMISSSTSLVVGGLIPCTLYQFKLYPRDANNTIIGQSKIISTKTRSLAPSTVRSVKAYMYSITTVMLEWQEPVWYPQCVEKYRIVWSKSENAKANVTEYETSTKHALIMDPCTRYKVSIIAVTYDKVESSPMAFAFTTSTIRPTVVEDVSILEQNTNMLIKWKPPRYGQSCVQNYLIDVKYGIGNPKYLIFRLGNQKNLETDKDGEISYLVEGVQSCIEYEITIVPMAGNMRGDPFVYIYGTKPRVFNKPTDGVITHISSTNVSTVWSFNDTKTNGCPLLKTVVTCYDSGQSTSLSREMSAVVVPSDNSVSVCINDLTPFTVYYCVVSFLNKAGSSSPSNYLQFRTTQDVPSVPTMVSVTDVTSEGFTLNWKPPIKTNGLILKYSIILTRLGLAYNVPPHCKSTYSSPSEQTLVPDTLTHYRFNSLQPYEVINVSISASTIVGFGQKSEIITIVIKPTVSEPVRNYHLVYKGGENYTVLWNQPCCTNGVLRYFIVDVTSTGKRDLKFKYRKIVGVDKQDPGAIYSFDLNDLHNEYEYTVDVYPEIMDVVNSSEACSSLTFTVPASVPPLATDESIRKHVQFDTSNVKSDKITVAISKNLFSDQRGEISYYAILVYRDPFYNHMENGFINSTVNWPRTQYWAESSQFDFVAPYQSTPAYWTPFSAGSSVAEYTIGENSSCPPNGTEFCNGPLNPGTSYFMKIRAFTRGGYQDTTPFTFRTANATQISYYLIIAVILIVICLILSGVFYIRGIGNLITVSRPSKSRRSQNKPPSRSPSDISPKKFIAYCHKFLASSADVKAEFRSLCALSEQNKLHTSVAYFPENHGKNRYNNVLPYDKTRVTIETGTASDYINASFIRGYGEIERKYIATQGPNLNTCRDFWQMVCQYDVDTVVMLCRIRDQNRTVCDKYFPDLNELSTYNDIAVECVASETNETFIRRRIVVSKGSNQKIVNHIYFQDWPDFGVPSDPRNLISLCRYVRKINKGDPIVVHCSAGIGRTGTFIACDILLDYVQNNKPINIFNIVLKLREQRMSMVQSEEQYEYLYKCIACVLREANHLPT